LHGASYRVACRQATAELRAASLRAHELDGALSACRMERAELLQSLDESESGRSTHHAAMHRSQLMRACIARHAEMVQDMLGLVAAMRIAEAEQAKVASAVQLEVCDLQQQLAQRQRAIERLEAAHASLRGGLTPERSWQDEQGDTPTSDNEDASAHGDEPRAPAEAEAAAAALLVQNALLSGRVAELTGRLQLLERSASAGERDASATAIASLQVGRSRASPFVGPHAMPQHTTLMMIVWFRL
jgi:hypothetical protein